MTADEFKSHITRNEPAALAESFVHANTVRALTDARAYEGFKAKIREFLPESDVISIVGSGNWGYSLNPDKFMMPFRESSDIDVAVVSEQHFSDTWATLREIHRKKWYSLSFDAQNKLRRHGENVYCGFVCPTWIPEYNHLAIYQFKSMLNKLSVKDVGYREIKMLYFRNESELIDYYKRGFSNARRRL